MKNWHWFHTFALIVIVFVIILIGTFFLPWPLVKGSSISSLITWWVMLVLLTLFVLILGHGTTGRFVGALIDQRNKISLSRLQLIIWTIVILSAFITAAFWNLINSKVGPLGIALPSEVWLLLGISTASLVGSPLILSNKTKTDANQGELQQQLLLKARQQNVSADPTLLSNQALVSDATNPALITDLKNKLHVDVLGQVPRNTQPDEASVADLFQGDEVGNFSQLDMSKVQLFLFTLVLVLTYASALGTMFANADSIKGISSFPILDQSMIVLLGISHAGYLSFKAIPHSTPPDQISMATPGAQTTIPVSTAQTNGASVI